MMTDDTKAAGVAAVVLLLTLVVAAVVWVGVSWLEASSFNRVTGKNVSTWDAMWIDLRVQEAPK